MDTKGNVQPILLARKDPLGKTLQFFAVDRTQPLGRAELLNRHRFIVDRIQLNHQDWAASMGRKP